MRVVFDTNVVVSALLFRGSASWLVAHWRRDEVVPLSSRETARELLRVLGYPKFALSSEKIEALAARYLAFVERIEVPPVMSGVPLCRDCCDQKFLYLAIAGHAEVLVTGDKDLLSMRDDVSFAMETPAEYLSRFS